MSDKAFRATPTEEPEEELKLLSLWSLFSRNRWLVAGTTAAVLLLGTLYTMRQRPVYESEATLRISDEAASRSFLTEFSPGGLGGGGKLETEIAVLRSRQIAEAVVDSLSLTVYLLEPNRPRDEVIRPLAAGRDAGAGLFDLRLQPNGTYAVAAEKTSPGLGYPRTVRPGTPFKVGRATLVLPASLASAPPERIRFSMAPFQAAVGGLRGALVVVRPDPRAQIVSIRYRSTDPQLAAAVPNVATGVFIHHKTVGSKAESRSAVQFLQGQVESYETELRGAEEQLRTFRERNQVVSLTDEASEQVKRLAELQAQRDALRSERDALAELLAQTNGGAATGSQTAAYRQLSSFPVFLSNQAVQNILQSLTELENERAKLLVQRTAENSDVQGVNQRIRELELQLYQIAVNYHRSLDSQVASVESALGRFGAQLEEIPAREVQFARLSREQTLLAEIYNLLHTRLKEAELKEAVEPGNVQTIDTALVPDRPISPRPLRNLAMALVGGLVLGMVGALTRETMDTKVRSKEDVHALSGGMPVLGTIPRIRMDAAPSSNGNGKRVRVPKIVSLSPDEFLRERLVTQHDPQSPAAEAYRALRTSITFAGVGRNTQALVVTSAMPGDGKSTSSSNLAIAFTQQGLRTLLIDADLRRGLLHKVFDMPQDPGLTHVLMGRAALDDAIRDTGVGPADTPLHFLPAGVFPPNPAELLGSERMRQLVADLRKRYDILVFDAPPLNLVTDASVLGTITDATLLVARAGVTDRRALHHAAAQLHQLGSAVSGIVLNDFDSGKAYGYTYGYATNGSSKNGKNGRNGKH